MTSPAGCNQHGFISTSRVRKTGVDWPDIQLYFFCLSTYSQFAKDISHVAAVDPKHYNSMMEPLQGLNTFGIGLTLVRPKSLGGITLRNSDPFSPPIIDPHYLEHPDDVHTLKEGSVFLFPNRWVKIVLTAGIICCPDFRNTICTGHC